MLGSIAIKSKQLVSKYILCPPIDRGLFYCAGRPNIGDSMVPWIIRKITGLDFEYSNPLERRGHHLLSIGSVLQYATRDCTIWGAGFISANSRVKSPPRSILCIRGPLTHKLLRSNKISAPENYCDPALLVPYYISAPKINVPTKKFGLILHYADKRWLPEISIARHKDVKLINIETDDIESFVSDVASCEAIISTSLHGVIIPEALGIPCVWAKCHNDVFGNDFKFHDYFLSTGRSLKPSNLFDMDLTKIRPELPPSLAIRELCESALQVFPNEYKS